jgi:serpin B
MLLKITPPALLTLALGASAFAQDAQPVSDYCKQTATPAPADIQAKVADPLLSFAAALYQDAAAKPGNLALSPVSIDAAVAMTLAGARGATAQEMADALRLPALPDAAWHRLEGRLLAGLTCPAPRRTGVLTIANGLFIQRNKHLLPDFVATMKDDYDAPLTEVDYKKDEEGARTAINQWVEQTTAGRIKDLIRPRLLTADTRLVLVDAVYLKDRWAREFPQGNTKDGPFHRTPADTVTTAMMYDEGGAHDFGLVVDPAYKAVSLMTKDHRTAMIVVVPEAVDGLAAIEGRVDGPFLKTLITGFRPHKVNLTLPKFKASSEMSLKPALSKLGIKRLFESGRADLAGIDGGKDQLYIGEVVHKAYVDVNEEGVEAAAATAAVGYAGAAMLPPTEPVVVKADRPFLYMIVDTSTQSPLFMGRVADPTAP